MIKAVIFDMDGLMIETEHLQSKSMEKVLKEYGIKPKINKDGVVQVVGITAKDNLLLFKKKYHINENVNVLLDKKQQIYLRLLKKQIVAKEGLVNLLRLLKRYRVKIAVASSSALDHILLVVSELKIKHFFKVLVSGEHLKKGKPHPDIFLKVAKDLGLKPVDCIVLEDAQPGVIAAKRANMKVIAVPNQFTKSQDFSKADLIVNSLKDIKWSTLNI